MVIDFVSDIACPWCAVGLNALERALQALQASQPDFAVQMRFQPYELNPGMATEGADIDVVLELQITDLEVSPSNGM